MSQSERPVLSEPEVQKLRRQWDDPVEGDQMPVALCDSHESLRVELTRLRAQVEQVKTWLKSNLSECEIGISSADDLGFQPYEVSHLCGEVKAYRAVLSRLADGKAE